MALGVGGCIVPHKVGYLGCLFAWMHPVRHLARGVRRAVTPRPIRRMLRTKNQIVHPLRSVEGAVFRSVDRAVTPPRRRKRKPPATSGANPTALPSRVDSLEKLSGSVNQLAASSRNRADDLLDAQMAAASPEQRARWMPVIKAQREGARIEFSREGHIVGWWEGKTFHPLEDQSSLGGLSPESPPKPDAT